MRIALVPGPGKSGLLCRLGDNGQAAEAALAVPDLGAAVASLEAGGDVRWVWPSATQVYPALLRAGVTVARCHDVRLITALLHARDGQAGSEPAAAAALLAERAAAVGGAAPARSDPGQLSFDGGQSGDPGLVAVMDDLTTVHSGQLAAISADKQPARFGLLAAAESAGALAACTCDSWQSSLARDRPLRPGCHCVRPSSMRSPCRFPPH